MYIHVSCTLYIYLLRSKSSEFAYLRLHYRARSFARGDQLISHVVIIRKREKDRCLKSISSSRVAVSRVLQRNYIVQNFVLVLADDGSTALFINACGWRITCRWSRLEGERHGRVKTRERERERRGRRKKGRKKDWNRGCSTKRGEAEGRAESTGCTCRSKTRRRDVTTGTGRGRERGRERDEMRSSRGELVGNRMDVHCVSVPIKSAGGWAEREASAFSIIRARVAFVFRAELAPPSGQTPPPCPPCARRRVRCRGPTRLAPPTHARGCIRLQPRRQTRHLRDVA